MDFGPIGECAMRLLSLAANTVFTVIVGILAVGLVLVIWYKEAALVVSLLDFNLSAIKAGCGLLPPPYGAMAESALRGGLAFDKTLLFAEGTVAIKVLLGCLRWVFSSNGTATKQAPKGH